MGPIRWKVGHCFLRKRVTCHPDPRHLQQSCTEERELVGQGKSSKKLCPWKGQKINSKAVVFSWVNRFSEILCKMYVHAYVILRGLGEVRKMGFTERTEIHNQKQAGCLRCEDTSQGTCCSFPPGHYTTRDHHRVVLDHSVRLGFGDGGT